MTYGTRVIRLNLKAIVGWWRWPFKPGTKMWLEADALPSDCAFIRVLKVEDNYVDILLGSQQWIGDVHEPPLEHPKFKYEGNGPGLIAIPSTKELKEIARG